MEKLQAPASPHEAQADELMGLHNEQNDWHNLRNFRLGLELAHSLQC